MTKFGKQKSIISCKTTYFGVLILLSIIISCGSPGYENDDHEEYVNSIRETASRILDNGDSLKARTFFDSAYQTIEKPGIGDIINRFSFGYVFTGANLQQEMGYAHDMHHLEI